MSSGPEEPKMNEGLNEPQARRLLVSCRYVDQLLSEAEALLNASASKAAFPRYIADISPAQRRTLEDYIARIRAQLARIVAGQGIAAEGQKIPAARAVRAALGAIEIAVEELKPKYMRGYGAVPPAVELELNGIVGELEGLVSRMAQFLGEGPGEDLHARLERLAQTSGEMALLGTIEEIVTRRGLVEFRQAIAGLLDRLEDTTFEIAVFGRVSSGKSSLLDAILETNILPVGITPITAVPTRVTYGPAPRVTVRFAERPAEVCGPERLPEFATEQQNPGNRKNVSRIVVELPSPRLATGLSFMDTPGLGSLATAGAAETMAYLPKCDLGVVLVDAASTLTPDDVGTVAALAAAAIPVEVLLSKADLLAQEDCARMVRYVKEHLEKEFRTELPVQAVSAMAPHLELMEKWFAERIAPLSGKSRELKAASVKRKVGALREAVAGALRARVAAGNGSREESAERVRAAEARLRAATGRIEEMRVACERGCARMLEQREEALREAAGGLLATEARDKAAASELRRMLNAFVHARVAQIHEALRDLALGLAGELRAVAQDLEIAPPAELDELTTPLRGTPVFAYEGPLEAPGRARVARLLGDAAERRRLAGRLARQMGEDWERALRIYFALLRAWCEAALREIKRRFDTHADSYRAQAERRLAGIRLTAEEERAIVSDLESLGATAAGRAQAEFTAGKETR